ncbi:DnaJ domain-containing protein [Ferruginibacter sp. SUN106]|uniref:DnaJ domain-containing protein n=1 Tax=Ferruginibacter sp. SUN106 TaxID=2978348 RepID=UPI003D35A663
MFIDYYKILSVDKNHTSDQIKKAYRKLALRYHPDTNRDTDSTNKFLEIQEAYEILSDLTKKIKYDYLYERHYQKNVKTEFEIFREKQIYKEYYNNWQKEARNNAITKSKEKFSNFKYDLIQTVGQGFNFSSNIFAIIFALVILGGTFVNLDTYLSGNKDAIYGVIICGILSLLIIIGLIAKAREI